MEGRFCAKCGAPAGAAASPVGAQPVPNPAPVSGPVAPSTPLAENVASALCYALMLITGILFLVLEPYNKNRNIRFHAFQAIFVSLALLVVRIAMGMVFSMLWSFSGWFFVSAVWMLFNLASMVLWIYLMVMAYQGKKIVLPVIGPLAQQQA